MARADFMSGEGITALKGHQEILEIDGEHTTTLQELWPESARAMIIGLNPAPSSVKVGHYYQGRFGKRQMERLSESGLFELIGSDAFLDDVAVTSGVGFADLVRRPTPSERCVSKSEILAGAERIKTELLNRDIPLVISVFRHPAQHLSGLSKRRLKPGFIELAGVPSTKLFRMPGPTAASSSADQTMAQLKAYLQEQRREK